MASNSSPRSESPYDIDFSVIRTSIQMNHKMIDQILNGIHYGSEEVRSLLREECDFILECKVCRNMFRSFPNFVAHKRVFCSETYDETVQKMPNAHNSARENIETVVVHPDAPNDPPERPTYAATKSTVESVIDATFEGKSKEYQFYTKVAEDLEREKLNKTKKTIVFNSIPTNRNAVFVTQSDGDNAEQVLREYKEQQEKKREEKARRIERKNRTITEVCRELAKKGKANQYKKPNEPVEKRISMRSRKSSPRKSMDYVTEEDSRNNDKAAKGNKTNDTVDITNDKDEWIDVNTCVPARETDYCSKKWMKQADLNNLECIVCNHVFSSLQSLKIHIKSKHMGQGPGVNCPVCTNVYENFNSLAKHLKQHHHMSDSMIYNIRMKKMISPTIEKKSPEKMETDQESKTDKGYVKQASNSEGGRKCDKCGKIFWKAKSFTRHLPCKSPKAPNKGTSGPQNVQIKSLSSNTTAVQKEAHSPKKSPTPPALGVVHSGSSVETVYMNSETKIIIKNPSKELLQLQEKLRAKALTPGASDATGNSNKEKESTPKAALAKKETTGGSKILYKVLTSPFQKVLPKLTDMKKAGVSMVEEMDKSKAKEPTKKQDQPSYSLRTSKVDKEINEKLSTDKGTKHVAKDTVKSCKGSNKESPSKDSAKATKEMLKDPPKTRASSSEKAGSEAGNKNTNEFKKLEERLTREAGISEDHVMNEPSEDNDNDMASIIDKQKVLLKSPNKNDLATLELQELQKKLTRKIMGPSPPSLEAPKEEEMASDVGNKDGKTGTVDNSAETFVEPRPSTRARSPERVKKVTQEKITEVKSKAGLSSETKKEAIAVKRHFRSVSQGADPVTSYGEKTPEKANVSIQPSPVISRRQSFPTSPTPSLNSNSGDGYNSKFKMMTVKEMAELVESASLTKFAKERKKKAKTFLTKKQARDTQKVASVLSRPIKKKKTKRKLEVRNVYETRRSGVGKSLRMIAGGTSKRLLLEQRRLQDSAGFVPENFYDSSRSKDAKRETDDEAAAPSKVTRRSFGAKEIPDGQVKKENNEKATTDDSTNARNQKTIPTQNIKIAPHTSSSRESSNERSRSREMKNLANSAGFVEKNFYSATSTATDSRDRSRSNESARSQIKGKDSESDSDKKPNNKKTNAIAIKETSDLTGNESDGSVGRMSRNRTRSVLVPGEIQHKLRNVSDSSTESKDRIKVRTGANKVANLEEIVKGHISDSAESGVSVTEKHEKREIRKVNNDDNSSKIQTRHTVKTIDDTSKHRTRLSTGSIYFDSELLKLSPTKIEKRLAEAKKDQESVKEKQIRAATCKKLNLSPRKIVSPQIKQGFYPKSTGIKQCPKCQRRFWKKKAYDFHMMHVCRDGLKSKISRKRGLSLSPKGKSADEKEGNEKTSDVAIKKAKLDNEVADLEKSIEAVRTVRKTGNKQSVTNKETDGAKSPKKVSPVRNEQSKNLNTKNEKSEQSSEMEVVSPVFRRTVTRSSDRSLANVKGTAESEKSGKGQLKEQTKQGEVSDIVESGTSAKTKTIDDKTTKTVIETKKDFDEVVSNKPDDDIKTVKGQSDQANEQDENVKGPNESSKVQSEKVPNDDIKGPNEIVKARNEKAKKQNENVKAQNQNQTDNNEIDNKTGYSSDNSGKKTENGSNDNVKTEKSATSLPDDDAQPGPSGLNTSQSLLDDDSDDGGDSDFSGFSEDDLKSTEEELSAHLNVSGKEIEHIVELEEDDLSDLGDLELSSDDDLDLGDERSEVTADNIDPNSKRPVRKSAQNRFSHVEEIWVYKEPGKPVKMRHQTPETREYVVEVSNPATILCHNSKDIDRLVDETNLTCKQCDAPCKSISNLRRHVIRHLGWKRYKCMLCSFACYDKSRSSLHQLRVHNVLLSNSNFSLYVIDLKKEATKLRAEKRTSTMRSAKKRSPSADNVYQKPKTSPPVKISKTSPKVGGKGDEKLPSPSQIVETKTGQLLLKARASLSKALK